MKCRHCLADLSHLFLDLGEAPPSNAYLSKLSDTRLEKKYPLRVRVCNQCFLVQTEDYAKSEEFFSSSYAYFSSISSSWLKHASDYVEMITNKLSLNERSFVVELASNDGYLLKNFLQKGIPCLGVEPTNSTAIAARAIGVPTIEEFFGEELANILVKEGKQADLIIGNNVYAHVPDINDFTKGIKKLLEKGGTVSLEFPHVLSLIKKNQFDTIYHEHFSYLSLMVVSQIFSKAGLKVIDVEEISTHGGSLRVYGAHDSDVRSPSEMVANILEKERLGGLREIATYLNFQHEAELVRDTFTHFLKDQKSAGKKVIGYGAAAKGNTLINFSGVGVQDIAFICDAAPSKQNHWMPGSHIPVKHPSEIINYKPDFIIIFPWNIAEEVSHQLSYVRDWGCKFVTFIPNLRTF
jgi:SAM-dependent methyltransferase